METALKGSLRVREDMLVILDAWGNMLMFNRNSGGSSINVADLNYMVRGK